MLLIDTYVAPSDIEGVGVFAAAYIPAGTVIWKLIPEFDRLLPRSEVRCLPPATQAFIERYSYPLLSEPTVLVLEVDNGRFMNHSTCPNTRFDNPAFGITIVEIPAHAEITCDYSEFEPSFEILPGRQFIKPETVEA